MVLNDLKPRDKFRFTEQARRKLGVEEDDVFMVLAKYGGPGSKRGVLIKNLTRREENKEVPADLEVILKERGEVKSRKKENPLFYKMSISVKRKNPLGAILLAFLAMLIIYLIAFGVYLTLK